MVTIYGQLANRFQSVSYLCSAHAKGISILRIKCSCFLTIGRKLFERFFPHPVLARSKAKEILLVMFLYATRQPILDANKDLFAYELLFRDSLENVFPEINADEATSKLIEDQLNIGVEDFTGDKPALINFTLDTLMKKYPTLLHQDHIVVQILETVQPGKKLLAECKCLKEAGYVIALDDYIHQAVWRHF
jgi:hypothetical protein